MDQEPLPQDPQFVNYAGYQPPPPPGEGKATASMVLGIVGLCMSLCCPIVGLVVGTTGLVLGVQANQQIKRKTATAGIIMCIISLVLSFGNAGVGCYMGATGRHPVSNWFLQQGGGTGSNP